MLQMKIGVAFLMICACSLRAQPNAVDVRRAALLQFRNEESAGRHEQARAAIMRLVDAGIAEPQDVAWIGLSFEHEQRLTEAERAFRRALQMAAGREDEIAEPIRYHLGRVLWASGRKDAAVTELAAASSHAMFEQSARFGRDQVLSEEWAAGRELFVAFADAIEAAGQPARALPYRKVAASGTLKAGLWAARAGNNEKALDYFAEAGAILPLDSFDTAVQMTVLRDTVAAYGRTARFEHAAAAAQQLFDLCHPQQPTGWTCPDGGVASDPFSGSSFVGGRIGGLRKLLDVHLKLLSKLTERAFISISWDPVSLARRPEATRAEFLGGLVGERSRNPDSDNGRYDAIKSCLHDSGEPYAYATGFEEDRVEFERCWFNVKMAAPFQRRLRGDLKPAEARLLVKGFLCELEFYSKFGIPENIEAVGRDSIAGVPLNRIEAAIASPSQPEYIRSAFRAGMVCLKLLKTSASWIATRPDARAPEQ